MKNLQVRWIALGVALFSVAGQAREWRGITPGESTRAQVIAQLGRPTKEVLIKGTPILVYSDRQAAPGTTQAQIKLDGPDGKVKRIDVFPKASLDTAIVEATYGKRCPDDGEGAGCYARKLSGEGVPYFNYTVDGLAVFFNTAGTAVKTISFMPAKKVDAPVVASPDPNEKPPDDGQNNVLVGASNTSLIDTENREAIEKDPLQIGGDFYLRGAFDVSQSRGAKCCDFNYGAPFIIDAYFDGRPSDRVRAIARPRFYFSPIPDQSGSLSLKGAQGVNTGFGFALDQLWVGFDIARTAFVTIGRQHVKWGVSRLWSPTDYLAANQKNPLAVFDDRVGVDMVKVQIPWESAGANFYAVGLIDPVAAFNGNLSPGAAFRAEWAFLTAEIGGGAIFQKGRKPRFAADLTAGVGPIDFRAEVALRLDPDVPLWTQTDAPFVNGGYPGTFSQTTDSGPLPSVLAGVSLPVRLNENRSLDFGIEGFFHSPGYVDDQALAFLLQSGNFQPFYYGKAYGALTASFSQNSPQSAVNISVIGNLIDRSFVGRIDGSMKFFNALNVEAFAEVPFGRTGTEFRPLFELPAQTLPDGRVLNALHVPLSYFRFGLALRISV